MRALCALCLLLAGCGGGEKKAGLRFRDVAGEAGLRFVHENGARGAYYMPEIMGAGGALFDFDADGDLDVFLVQGGDVERPETGSGNRLFRNELVPEGRLRFTDVSQAAGVDFRGYGMGAAVGDFNNDGRPDLVVTNFGANILYENRGDGTFRDVTAASPAVRKQGEWSSSAAFFDYDRDGWLDLVILTYVDFTVRGNKRCFAPTGEADYCTPKAYRPVAARLFHNEKGRFVDVTAQAGVDRAKGPGLGVTAVDANGDGWDDLFVANDTEANHLWINQKDGTFLESGLAMGAAYSDDGVAKAGMGVAAGDYDGDGREDLLVLNLMREGATLFRNEGRGYRDVSLASKVHALTFAFTGFGVGWIDADNDGRPDLFLANGAVTRREEQRGQAFPFRERNLLLRNLGGEFEDVTGAAGAALALEEVTRGAAFGDVDNDGRMDVLITNNGGPARLLRTDSEGVGNWMQAGLAGPGLGEGARVGVEMEDGRVVWQRVRTSGSYLTASSPAAHFGLGAGRARRVVAELWNGTKLETRNVAGGRVTLSAH